jgi:L-cysteine/cystine lyase
MTDLDRHRQKFPHIQDYSYFNYGGQGLLPTTAIEAMHQAQLASQRLGPFSNQAGLQIYKTTDQLKQTLALALGFNPSHLALTENTTLGCNIVLWGLDWRSHDRILLTDCEHQGIVAIAQELAARFDLSVDLCPVMNSPDPLEAINQALTPQTRILVLSHILWNTGQVLPLEAIVTLCHSKGVQVLVDGAQSVGVLPLDLTAIDADYYAFTGHKWWCGPPGLGGLHINPRNELRSTFLGWRSVVLDGQGQPEALQSDARRYEVSTAATTMYPGLMEAIATHQSYGSDSDRQQQICDRSRFLWQALQSIEGVTTVSQTPPRSGLVAFQLASGHHGRAVEHLEQSHIYLRQILNPDCLRASLHYFTSESEIKTLIDGIAKLVS